MNLPRSVCAILMLSTCVPCVALAQAIVVRGSVADAQGAVVVGAVVTLTADNGAARMARTGSDGAFGFEGVSPGTYVLQAAAPGFAPWRETIPVTAGLNPLSVTLQVAGIAEGISVTGSVPTTLQRATLTGSRLGITLLETPASVQMLSGDVIRERGDPTIAEAKSRAAGVTAQPSPGNGGGGLSARGFSGVGSVMQLYDGAQFFIGSGTVSFPFDPWMVERIEVLGGPGSVLYGNGAIGGVINVVPRKPSLSGFDNTVRIAGGSHNSWRAALGSGGPLNERVFYRADISHNRSDGWVDRGDSDGTALSGSIRFDVTPRFNLTFSEDYGYQRPDLYFGAPTIDGQVDEARKELNYNVTDADIKYKDNWTQFKAEWQPGPQTRVRSSVHFLTTNRHWRNAENYAYLPGATAITQSGFLEIFHHQRQVGNRTEALFNGTLLGRANALSVGADYNFIRFQHTNNSPYGGSRTIGRDDAVPGTFLNLAGTYPRFLTHSHQMSVFAEDRVVLTPKFSLVGGVRFDRHAVERQDLVTTAVSERTFTPATGRGGVVYTVKRGLAVDGQYTTGTDAIGNIISQSSAQHVLDLTEGRQVEVGAKQSFWNERAEWTVATYRIVKENLLAPDPVNPGVSLQIGQQSSRGFEATTSLALPRGLRLDANAAFLDARFDDFSENVGGVLVSRVGNTPPAVPQRMANVWVTWDPSNRWQARGGVRYVGPRFLNNANSVSAPSYTVVDVGVQRSLTDRVALDLRIFNLFDTFYAQNIYGGAAAPQWLIGRPRAAELAITADF